MYFSIFARIIFLPLLFLGNQAHADLIKEHRLLAEKAIGNNDPKQLEKLLNTPYVSANERFLFAPVTYVEGAVRFCHPKILETLISHGADVGPGYEGNNWPLEEVIGFGGNISIECVDTFKVLLKADIDTSEAGSDFRRQGGMLHEIARRCSSHSQTSYFVRLLIEHGEEGINDQIEEGHNEGKTPAHIVAEHAPFFNNEWSNNCIDVARSLVGEREDDGQIFPAATIYDPNVQDKYGLRAIDIAVLNCGRGNPPYDDHSTKVQETIIKVFKDAGAPDPGSFPNPKSICAQWRGMNP